MKVLALDTAQSGCSVALADSGRLLARRDSSDPRRQAELLLPLIEAAMQEAAMRYPDLDLIAVTIGPGSFSGLRVGLSAARGLGLASGRPVIGIGTLEALAGAVPSAERAGRHLVAVIDAGRGEVYLQLFPAEGEPAPPRVLACDRAAGILPAGRLLLVGSGTGSLGAALAGRDWEASRASAAVDAAVVSRLAERRGVPPPGSEPPSPLYLRPPDARLPAGGT